MEEAFRSILRRKRDSGVSPPEEAFGRRNLGVYPQEVGFGGRHSGVLSAGRGIQEYIRRMRYSGGIQDAASAVGGSVYSYSP